MSPTRGSRHGLNIKRNWARWPKMKMKFKTIMNDCDEFVWQSYEDDPGISDAPVLLRPEDAGSYLIELIENFQDCDVNLGVLRICDVEVSSE
jgi:hypothetical protein